MDAHHSFCLLIKFLNFRCVSAIVTMFYGVCVYSANSLRSLISPRATSVSILINSKHIIIFFAINNINFLFKTYNCISISTHISLTRNSRAVFKL